MDGRCAPCAALYHNAAYGPQWQALSRRERAKVKHCTCAGCVRHTGPCMSTHKLSLDHTFPVALGGTAHTGVSVLCQSCNSAKRDRPTAAITILPSTKF